MMRTLVMLVVVGWLVNIVRYAINEIKWKIRKKKNEKYREKFRNQCRQSHGR